MNELTLRDFLPYQLSVLSAQVSREFSSHYQKQHGLSVSEWRILAHLSQQNKPMSVREIFRQVDMDKSKVSRAASRLRDRGLVKKDPSQVDARLVELALSPAGFEMVQTITPLALAFENQLVERLGNSGDSFRDNIKMLISRNEDI